MSPRQRILAIRLTEKLAKNPEYADNIGVKISNQKDRKGNSNKFFSEQAVNCGQ